MAANIVKDLGITKNGEFDIELIKDTFRRMMILGPAIELYVIDQQGNLVAYDAVEEKIKLNKISLEPIVDFIQGKRILPILGDDPRSKSKKNIFCSKSLFI